MKNMQKNLLPSLENFHISYGFIALLAVLLLTDTQGLVLYTLAAMSVHEAGHLTAIALFGGSVAEINVHIAGMEIKLSHDCRFSFFQETAVRLAGPLAGFLAAVICSRLGTATGDDGFFILSGANIMLSAVNLFPVKQTDGGTALYYIMCMLFSRKHPELPEKIVYIISRINAAILILLGFAILLLTKSNITLIIVGVYLIVSEDGKYM